MFVSLGALEYSKLKLFAQINGAKLNRFNINDFGYNLLKLGEFLKVSALKQLISTARQFL